MKERILLADDVEELAKTVGAILKYNNYDVDIVYNGKEALDKVSQNIYDCIILDVMMPVMDGIETVKQLRKLNIIGDFIFNFLNCFTVSIPSITGIITSNIMMPVMDGIETVKQLRKLNIKSPIILLTAKDLIDDKVEGLDSGANDYITKPFENKELLARIRALTREKEENEEEYSIGNLIFNKGISQLSRDKISLHLNSKECDIMEFLLKNQERKISAEELKQRIWTSENNCDNVVPMYITYLQEKFTALNANIKIDNNNGYSLKKLI